MPKYDFVCPTHGKIELSIPYEEFDNFAAGGYRCPLRVRGELVNRRCKQAMSRDYTDRPPVATFYGSDFTRRSTDSRQNMRIDHNDKRSTQSYPGKPGKKADRSWH